MAGQKPADKQGSPRQHTARKASAGKRGAADVSVGKMSPSQVREQAARAVAAMLTGGDFSADDLAKLIDEASNGVLPATAAAQRSIADALFAGLSGKKVNAEQAAAIGAALANAADSDGMTPERSEPLRAAMNEALTQTGVSPTDTQAIDAALDRCVAEQHDPPLLALRETLHTIATDSEVAPENVQKLGKDLAAAAPPPANGTGVSRDQFASDLATVIYNSTFSARQEAQLVHALVAALRPAASDQAAADAVKGVKTLLIAGRAPQAQVQKVLSALRPPPATQPAGAG